MRLMHLGFRPSDARISAAAELETRISKQIAFPRLPAAEHSCSHPARSAASRAVPRSSPQ